MESNPRPRPDPYFAGGSNPYEAPKTAVTTATVRDVFGRVSLATRGQRFAGAVLDNLAGVAALGVGGALGYLLESQGIGSEDVLIGGLAVVALLALEGLQAYLIVSRGQSLGKIVMRTRIVRVSDDSLAGFGRAVVLRHWVPAAIRLLGFIGNLFALADAAVIFGEERRCLHDYMADTKVVQARDARKSVSFDGLEDL